MPLPFVLAGVFAVAVLGKTKAMGASALVIDQYKRRKGYRAGEGPLTARDGGLGVYVALDSKSDIGQFISALSLECLDLKEYDHKVLEITLSESEDLRAMVWPALELMRLRTACRENLELLEAQRASFDEAPRPLVRPIDDRLGRLGYGIDVSIYSLHEYDTSIKNSLLPLVSWLRQFPRSRIKVLPEKLLDLMQARKTA